MARTPRSPPSNAATVQRSFRLNPRTLELLDARAAETDESRNALTQRLLEESVRIDRHPLIYYRQGASGRRRPALVGTRLDVGQVMSTVRGEAGDVESAAEYFSIAPRLIQAAVDFYAEFTDEIDAQHDEDRSFAEIQRQRWERAQRVLG